MDVLVEFLGNWFADETSLRIAVIGLAALVFAVFGLGVSYLFLGASDPVRRRLQSNSGAEYDGSTERGQDEGRGFNVTLDTLLGPVSRYVLPANDVERGKMQQKLSYAGFKHPNALQNFYALKTGLAIGLPLIVYSVGSFFPQLTTKALLYYTLGASGIGLLLPNFVLERLMEKRMKALRNGFPDALDLLVVCVEAGLGISQAIQRVANELEVSHPELAEELMLVNAEVRAGVDRVDALKNLATRIGLEEVKGLVSLLVQTLRFGTSIAESLRIYAAEFRDKRMQEAEEQAAKLGTKLIFPLILFLFPAFFVVAVGPAVLRLMEAFAA